MPDWKVITDYMGFALLFMAVGWVGLIVPLIYIVREFRMYGGPYHLSPFLDAGLLFIGSVFLYCLAWIPFQQYREARRKAKTS